MLVSLGSEKHLARACGFASFCKDLRQDLRFTRESPL